MAGDKWVEIYTTTSETEAIMIKGLLEGEGMGCMIKSSRVPQFPVTVNGLAEMQIIVRQRDRAESLNIIRRYRLREVKGTDGES